MLQSNPAYFQMEKNEEFTLETDKDYTEMGKRAYKSAEEYFRIFEKCFYMLFNGDHKAICMNISFACELYMKSLLFHEQISCGRKHDLSELYSMLPSKKKRNKGNLSM